MLKTFTLLVLMFAVSASPAFAAKPVQPKLTKSKVTGSTISVTGSVKLPAKSAKAIKRKKLKVTVTATGNGPKATKSVAIKAKKKAATVKFKVALRTSLSGNVRLSAVVYAGKKKLGKASKTRRVIVPAPSPPPAGDPDHPGIPVGVGGGFTCALVRPNFKCWGAESNGELANGPSGETPTPTTVIGGLQDVLVDFSIGSTGGCIQTAAVGVSSFKCWGRNANYQVGNGSSDSVVDTPSTVVGLPYDPSHFARGDQHACATVNFEVWCWGNNSYGQIGNGVNGGNVPSPTKVWEEGGEQFGGGVPYGVAAGGLNSCVNTSNGIWCWGVNNQGQLGNGVDPGTMFFSSKPVHVAGPIAGIADITRAALSIGNDHVCATLGWHAYCWGSNQYGQLGIGPPGGYSTIPVTPNVLPITDTATITAGYFYSCALALGKAYCWGFNENGKLGTGAALNTSSGTPTGVVGLDAHVGSISAGWTHACASKNLALYCWGANGSGQLGTGTPSPPSAVPVAVNGL